MSLSTSSSKGELKVIGLVVIVLFVSEIALRLGESSLSRDVKHIQQIPAISEKIAKADGTRILFLGNSQVRTNLDPAIISQELTAHGQGEIYIERVYPDATGLGEWYYTFRHYFVDNGNLPNLLVICFADIDLEDERGLDPSLLAHYYSSAKEVPEIFHEDIRDFDGRTEFLLSGISSSFANRTRVRTRLLNSLIPGYQDTAQRLNREMKAAQKPLQKKKPNYHRLQRLLVIARNNGVRLVIVAMPQANDYSLDPQVPQIIQSEGGIFIDCRQVEGLNRSSFVDEMHLNSDGATIYSHYLARQLAARIRPNLMLSQQH